MTEPNVTLPPLDEQDFPRPITWRHFVLFMIPAILAAIEIPHAVASWDIIYPALRGPFSFTTTFLSNAEQYVGDYTIAGILVVIWVFTPRFRRTIVPYLIALIIASLIVTAVKVTAARARPPYGAKMEQEERDEIREYLAETDNAILRAEKGDYWLFFSKGRPGIEFVGWFDGSIPFGERNNALSTGDYSSFPSGHSASAFLLAAYLTMLFPRARWLWYAFAFGTAISRIRFRMHYPGDVLFGGALGWITLHLVFSKQWPFALGVRVQRGIEALELKFARKD